MSFYDRFDSSDSDFDSFSDNSTSLLDDFGGKVCGIIKGGTKDGDWFSIDNPVAEAGIGLGIGLALGAVAVKYLYDKLSDNK